ncbi:MAG: transglycosylase SLT domain-containing protein [Deltaproteobacteria bacterium]|nr:transglycosylase SLT domain-containing protein [Deltaproteobacteria bacterium]
MTAVLLSLVILAAPPAPLAKAASALGEQDDVLARAEAEKVIAAGGSDVERARLIAGVAAHDLGDHAAAVKFLEFPAGHLGALEPYHQLALGDARFYAGDPAGAVAPFTAARDGAVIDALASRAAGRLGDALLASGKSCDAVAAFKSRPHAEKTAEWLSAMSRAQAGCGDAKGARDTEHQLWLTYAEHPAAATLEATFGKQARPEDRLQRAKRLFEHVGPAAAAAEAELGIGLKPRGELRARLLLLKARALAELKERPAATDALNAAVRAAPKSEPAAEAQTLLARAAWRRGDMKTADALFDAVGKRRDRTGDDAAFLDAFLPFDKGQYADAIARFEQYLSQRPSSRKSDEAAWFAAYAALRAGDKPRAHDGFERLVKRYPASSLVPQALYWEAKLSAPKDADPLFRSCIRAAPLGFYAALSRVRLAELGKPPEPPAPTAALAPPQGNVGTTLGTLAVLAQALSDVGLWNERGEALDAAIRSTHDPDASAQLAAFCVGLGEWGRAYAVANGRLWHKALEEKNPSALALLYPRAYPELVEPAAQSFGLDPAFAWAIMRRESAFDPRVESGARAIGLMQMLAPTAQKIAGLLGEKDLPSGPDLHRPDTEVPLGVWYLAELAGRFGHAGLAAAAYNAGPQSVNGWMEKNGNLPFDEFVEAIPFRETRLYVKNVVGDYLAYRALYGDRSPAMPLEAALPTPRPGADF